MNRVRIHIPNPSLAAIPPSLIRNPQRAIALAEGARVYVDFIGSPTSKHRRLSLLFCFSGAAEARRREIVGRFLAHTFRSGDAAFAAGTHGFETPGSETLGSETLGFETLGFEAAGIEGDGGAGDGGAGDGGDGDAIRARPALGRRMRAAARAPGRTDRAA